jgi:hypothetical protein
MGRRGDGRYSVCNEPRSYGLLVMGPIHCVSAFHAARVIVTFHFGQSNPVSLSLSKRIGCVMRCRAYPYECAV